MCPFLWNLLYQNQYITNFTLIIAKNDKKIVNESRECIYKSQVAKVLFKGRKFSMMWIYKMIQNSEKRSTK